MTGEERCPLCWQSVTEAHLRLIALAREAANMVPDRDPVWESITRQLDGDL